MTVDFVIKRGDTLPILTATLSDANGPINLTGAVSVVLHLASFTPAVLKVSRACDIINAATGAVSFTWQDGDTDTVGDYYGEFAVTWSGSRVETFPNTKNIRVRVGQNLISSEVVP